MTISGHKIRYAATTAGGLLLILFIVPQTRYVVPGFFVKSDVSLQVLDTSGQAVADATVTIGTVQQKTDTSGVVVLQKIPVGSHTVSAAATFYDTAKTDIKLPLFGRYGQTKIVLQPIGEVTKITIKNRISGRPVIGARVVGSQGGSGITNSLGTAIVAMPKGTKNATATITGQSIVTFVATIRSDQSSSDNIVYVTPSGRIAYLQKNSEKLQVVSSNIDGTEPVVLLDGTGNEDLADTQLISSASQKFAALKARRDSTAALYIIDTSTAGLTALEASGQSYIPVGWHGDIFVYLIYSKQPLWQAGAYKLKAYDAINGQTIILDESRAEGASVLDYASEVFENIYIMPEGIVYAKKWQASYYYGARLANKQMTLTLSDNSGNKQDVAQWQAGYNAAVKTKQIGPARLGIFIELDGVNRSYFSYSNKVVKQDTAVSESTFKAPAQDIYASSPNNLFSAWQAADNTNYLGTVDGTVATHMQLPFTYRVVGWYNNDYVLLIDTASRILRIADRNMLQNGISTFSIGRIYVPSVSYKQNGYGR